MILGRWGLYSNFGYEAMNPNEYLIGLLDIFGGEREIYLKIFVAFKIKNKTTAPSPPQPKPQTHTHKKTTILL